ncbi:MAG: AarF/ABC1/UbiB kinase family protein, partial [Planctomycetia bacterium]|nr:AarF/ABC1/UbiB kinase family protein [Planctomycetia bacterium]
PQLSTSRVLTMQRIDGLKLADAERLRTSGVDVQEVARRGSRIFLEMIFSHGVYHADPHPGNIVVLDGNVIGLLDFGQVGSLDDELREDVEEMLLALAGRDAGHLTSIVMRIGATPPDLDRPALSLDIEDYISHYANVPLAEFDLAGAITELTQIIRRHQIMLPARLAMLLKVLVELEGTARRIHPSFSLNEVIEPYHKKLRWRRLSPQRQMRKLWRIYNELEHLAEILPRGVIDILNQVQTGKFDVHLDHRGLEPSVNRLVLGLLASALFVGSAMMLCQKVPPLLKDTSVLGASGCVLSIVLGLRLLWAIRRSGHLDRNK